MNSTTGRCARWYVRIIDPKVIQYSFQSRGESVGAEKFECVLVCKDPTQYMIGLAPFSFSDRHTATKAAEKLKEEDVLEITSPAFGAKARVDLNVPPRSRCSH